MVKDFELIGGPEFREIKVVSYAPKWPLEFEAQKNKIKSAIDGQAIRIEHIGSTSIEGLSAKPIIDIQLSVIDVEDEKTYLPFLEAAGYKLRVRQAGHRMVRTNDLGAHVHICAAGSDWERRHILFRDYLRANQADKRVYENLKKQLAKQTWETMNHYNDAKSTLIKEIAERAETWAQNTGWKL